MKIRLLIILYFSLNFVVLRAQAPITNAQYPILKAPLAVGIFRTFADFKAGKIEKLSGELFFNENSEVSQYLFFGKKMKLVFRDSASQMVSLVNPPIWGFCDGKDIYIRDHAHYCKLQVGKFCYYTNEKQYVYFFIPVIEERMSFFDLDNGVVLDIVYLGEVLKRYPELRKSFVKEEGTKGRNTKYLQKLNEQQ